MPKTIDNDIGIIDRSFGFMTAVSEATRAIEAARTEAESNRPNGIGVVKLMGRSARASWPRSRRWPSQDVDLCLVPEVPIVLEDALPHLERVVDKKGHAVVVVAEGAGEELLGASAEKDAGGNKKLPPIGAWLTKQIKSYFKSTNREVTVKYIDPSVHGPGRCLPMRGCYLCMLLAHAAAHGAMAGYTGFTVGLVKNKSVMIPIPELARTSPRSMNARLLTWERVVAVTNQPCAVARKEVAWAAGQHARTMTNQAAGP